MEETVQGYAGLWRAVTIRYFIIIGQLVQDMKVFCVETGICDVRALQESCN